MGDDRRPDELMCFMNMERICGPDCVSFRTIPDENVQLDSNQQHCILLSSVERAGRSLNIIAGLINNVDKRMRRNEEDAQRGAAHIQQSPLGGAR